MNLIETNSLILAEKQIRKILKALKQGDISKTKTLLQRPLLDENLLRIKTKTLDNRLMHYFNAVHKILNATHNLPKEKRAKKHQADNLGKSMSDANGLINGIEKDADHWEKIFLRPSVHQVMAEMLTKNLFNDPHWHLLKNWKGWIPHFASLALTAIQRLSLPAKAKIISVTEVFDYFSEATTLAPLQINQLKTARIAMDELAKNALDQDPETILSHPNYEFLTNTLLLPKSLFQEMCSYAQVDLCLSFLSNCGAESAKILRYLDMFVERNYFPKSLLHFTESQQTAPDSVKVFIAHKNLQELLLSIKNQTVFYDDDKIKLNTQIQSLSKNLMMSMTPDILHHPAFDKPRMADAALTVIDAVWQENELKKHTGNHKVIALFFIRPMQVLYAKDTIAREQLYGQRLDNLVAVVIDIIRLKTWSQLDHLYQKLFFNYAATLFVKEKSKLEAAYTEVSDVILAQLFKFDLQKDAIAFIDRRIAHNETLSYPTTPDKMLRAILTFIAALPKEEPNAQTESLTLEHHFQRFFPAVKALQRIFNKIPLHFLDEQFLEFKPFLREKFLNNTYFLQSSIKILYFLVAQDPSYRDESGDNLKNGVAQLAKILACDVAVSEEFHPIPSALLDQIEQAESKPFTPNGLTQEMEWQLANFDVTLKQNPSANFWLKLACQYLQGNTILWHHVQLAQLYTNILNVFHATLASQQCDNIKVSDKPTLLEHKDFTAFLESKKPEDTPTADEHNAANKDNMRSNIDNISTNLAKIKDTAANDYLLNNDIPIELALYKLLPWFVVNDNQFDLPSEIKALFLGINTKNAWEKKILAYWELVFSLPVNQVQGRLVASSDNECILAHQNIYTKEAEVLLVEDLSLSPLPSAVKSKELLTCLQVRLACAFFIKLMPYMTSHFKELTARALTYARANYFPNYSQANTLLSLIMACHEQLEHLKQKFRYNSTGANKVAKRFISIEGNLLFLKYLSIIAFENTPIADLNVHLKLFVAHNLAAFMSEYSPPPGVDSKAFYKLTNELQIRFSDDPELVGQLEMAALNVYLPKLMSHGLIKEANDLLFFFLTRSNQELLTPEDISQFWGLTSVFQYVAHRCNLFTTPPKLIAKDDDAFLNAFSQLKQSFFESFFMSLLDKQSLQSKLIEVMEEYPETQTLRQALKGEDANELQSSSKSKRKRKKNKAKEEAGESTVAESDPTGAHPSKPATSNTALLPFPSFFTSKQAGKITLNTTPIEISVEDVPLPIRTLMIQLSSLNQEIEFALYGLCVAQLFAKIKAIDEYTLCIAISSQNLMVEVGKLITLIAQFSFMTNPSLVDHNVIEAKFRDNDGAHKLKITVINHRPNQIIFDCIEYAKFNITALCLLMTQHHNTFYPGYGPAKGIAHLRNHKTCILQEPEHMLFKTNFKTLFELVYYELRCPRYEKNDSLTRLANDSTYLRECFCHYLDTHAEAPAIIHATLEVLFRQCPMMAANTIMTSSILALDALSGIGGENITKTLAFLKPYEKDSPSNQLQSLYRYMLIQYGMLAKNELKKNPEMIDTWIFNSLLNHALGPELNGALKTIVVHWVSGQPSPVVVDDAVFFALRSKLGRHYKHTGFDDIGRPHQEQELTITVFAP